MAQLEILDDLDAPVSEILEKLPVPVLCAHLDGRVLLVNDRFRQLFGYGPDRLRTVDDWWRLAYRVPSYRQEIQTRWLANLRLIGRAGPRPVEGEVICADGSTRMVEAHVAVLERSRDRKIYIVNFIDVSMQRELVSTLEQARDAAEVNAKARAMFLANMGHELRTPLNAIIGFSELMLLTDGREALSEKHRQYVDDVHASGVHLLEIINAILDLTKIEAGQVSADLQPVCVEEILEGCCRLIIPKAAAGGVAVRIQSSPNLMVSADPTLLRRIILNLLSNAVKFTPAGGSVTITANPLPGSREAVAIAVSDTGIGMSDAEIEVALLPFRQVDPSLARRHEGTGLGLTIAKDLTELQGGTLTITSAPDSGTTVRVILSLYLSPTAE